MLSRGDGFGGPGGSRYQVRERIGSSPGTEVLLCFDAALQRSVVAKLAVAAGQGAADVELARFERERVLSARVRHPDVLAVHDCGVLPGGAPYLVTEWMEHGSTRDLVDLHPGGLPPAHAHEYVLRLASALAAVHRAGLVHRDVKPANLFVDREGRARLGDFGLARGPSEGSPPLTERGTTVGTLGFIAPEQLRGLAGPQSDLFSWGITAGVLFTGAVPAQKTVNGIPRGVLLDGALDGLPAAWRPVVARACAAELSDRYPSADHLLADLERLPRPEPTTAADLPPLPALREPSRPPSPPRRQRGVPWAVAGAAALAVAGAVATLGPTAGRRGDATPAPAESSPSPNAHAGSSGETPESAGIAGTPSASGAAGPALVAPPDRARLLVASLPPGGSGSGRGGTRHAPAPAVSPIPPAALGPARSSTAPADPLCEEVPSSAADPIARRCLFQLAGSADGVPSAARAAALRLWRDDVEGWESAVGAALARSTLAFDPLLNLAAAEAAGARGAHGAVREHARLVWQNRNHEPGLSAPDRELLFRLACFSGVEDHGSTRQWPAAEARGWCERLRASQAASGTSTNAVDGVLERLR